MLPRHGYQIDGRQSAWINAASSNHYVLEWGITVFSRSLVLWETFSELWTFCSPQVNRWLAVLLPAFLEGTGASPGWPRMTWAFLATPCPCQVSRDIVSSPQADGRANARLSSKDPLPPIGRDTRHRLSISIYLRPACPLPSSPATPSHNWASVERLWLTQGPRKIATPSNRDKHIWKLPVLVEEVIINACEGMGWLWENRSRK